MDAVVCYKGKAESHTKLKFSINEKDVAYTERILVNIWVNLSQIDNLTQIFFNYSESLIEFYFRQWLNFLGQNDSIFFFQCYLSAFWGAVERKFHCFNSGWYRRSYWESMIFIAPCYKRVPPPGTHGRRHRTCCGMARRVAHLVGRATLAGCCGKVTQIHKRNTNETR